MNMIKFWNDVEIEVSCRLNCDFQVPIDFGGIMFIESLAGLGVLEILSELKWLFIGRWLLPFDVVYVTWREELDPDFESDNKWLFETPYGNKFWFLLEGMESGIVE